MRRGAAAAAAAAAAVPVGAEQQLRALTAHALPPRERQLLETHNQARERIESATGAAPRNVHVLPSTTSIAITRRRVIMLHVQSQTVCAEAVTDRCADEAPEALVRLARETLRSTRANESIAQRPPTMAESTIDGHRATDLICWPYMRNHGECGCDGTKAHILKGACGGSVSALLGGRHVCRRKGGRTCHIWHPELAEVHAELERWWLLTAVVGSPRITPDQPGEPALAMLPDATADTAHVPSPLAAPRPLDQPPARPPGPPVWSTTSLRVSAEASSERHPPRRRQPSLNSACKGGARSEASSAPRHPNEGHDTSEAGKRADDNKPNGGREDGVAGEMGGQRRCTVPLETLLGRISRHRAESSYIDRFLSEPFLPSLLANDASRTLLSMRNCAKEVSEAYGAAEQVVSLLHARGVCVSSGGGEGAVVLDICCGKGLTGLLLSCMLPRAQLLLFDANGDMELSHVASRPTMRFTQLDIFAADAIDIIRDRIEVARERSSAGAIAAIPCQGCVIATGTHLCGSLSPRLIDLAIRLPNIDALVLSPCCLRGALGSRVTREARIGRPGVHDGAYRLLVSTLAALCRTELDADRTRRQPHRRLPPHTQEQDRLSRLGLAPGSTDYVADDVTASDGAAVDGGGADMLPEPPHGHGPHGEAYHGLADDGTACIPCVGELLRWDAVGGDDDVDVTSEAVLSQQSVRVTYDQNVISPKNAFIVLQKVPTGTVTCSILHEGSPTTEHVHVLVQ